MKLILCFAILVTVVTASLRGSQFQLSDNDLSDRELSAKARRMLQGPGGNRPCRNPTCTSPPCASPLLGDIGCTSVAGVAEYEHESISKGGTISANTHIFGPFENGFGERQKDNIMRWGCTDPTVAYDSAGGKDISLTELETAYKCNIQFPRIEGNKYIGVVGKCGGHTRDYHFHRSFSCLYSEQGGHSPAVGKIGSHSLYGKWENYQEKLLPLLDACGGHWGPTPDCEWCYHYHVQDRAPFTVGCMGPASDGGLVSIKTCRALYNKCGDGTETIPVGKDKSVKYDRFCPCFDADGSNTNTKELQALSTDAIAIHADTGKLFGGKTTPTPITTPNFDLVAEDKRCYKASAEQNLPLKSAKRSSLEECLETCLEYLPCKGVTYFKSKWCRHYTECDKPSRNSAGAVSYKYTGPRRKFAWSRFPKMTCEKMPQRLTTSGKVASEKECKTKCKKESNCVAVLFWNKNKGCNLFSEFCEPTKNQKGATYIMEGIKT